MALTFNVFLILWQPLPINGSNNNLREKAAYDCVVVPCALYTKHTHTHSNHRFISYPILLMLMTMILYIVSILNSLYTQTRYMYRLRVVALVVANIPYKIHLSFRDLKLERRTLCTALWLHGFNHSPRTYIHKTKRKKNNNITIRMANSRLWKLLDRIHVCACNGKNRRLYMRFHYIYTYKHDVCIQFTYEFVRF